MKSLFANQLSVAGDGTEDVQARILSALPHVVVWDDCGIYDKLANLENRCQTADGNGYASVLNKRDGRAENL